MRVRITLPVFLLLASFAVCAPSDVRGEHTPQLLGTPIAPSMIDRPSAEAEQQALASDEKAFGPESYRAAVDWNDLGAAYDLADRTRDAERCYKRCLQMLKKLPGSHPPEQFTVYVNLGYMYLRDRRAAKSESAFSHALKAAKRGANIPPTAVAEIKSKLAELNRRADAGQQARLNRDADLESGRAHHFPE